MLKKVFIPGLLGTLVLFLCTIVFNVVFGLNTKITQKQVPNERVIYEVLKGNVTDPGVYLCNPALTSERRFPDKEPVYGIQYSGIGHESAGIGELLGLLIILAAPNILTLCRLGCSNLALLMAMKISSSALYFIGKLIIIVVPTDGSLIHVMSPPYR